jgi:hypothetical protein
MTNCLQPPNLFKNLPGWVGGFLDIKKPPNGGFNEVLIEIRTCNQLVQCNQSVNV